MQKTSTTLSLLLAILLASTTCGGILSNDSPSSDAKTPTLDQGHQGTPSVTEDLVMVDVTGVMSCDQEGDATNQTITVDLFAALNVTNPGPNHSVVMTGVGWDLVQTAGLDSNGGSWLSEMVIGFDYEGDGINDLFLTPSTTDGPGVDEANSSGGIVNLVDAGLGNGNIPSGMLKIEFFESYDDEADVCEAIYASGMLTVDAFAVPEPGTMGLSALLLIGFAFGLQRK